jgi:hypothetical protein
MWWYNFLRSVFGVSAADRMTKYQYWTVPPAENVDPPRITRRVRPTGERVRWEAKTLNSSINGYRGTPGTDGVMAGTPIQWGTDGRRSLTFGSAKDGLIGAVNPDYKTRIPLPKLGWYWLTGHPVPMFDKICMVREPHPTDVIIHEMIQLDPFQPENIFSNQALNWGKWVNGTLVEGGTISATRDSVSNHLITPWVQEKPHRPSMVVRNYIGADGPNSGITLTEETGGIRAGSIVMLDPESESYKSMIAKGGVCATIAQMCVDYGVLVADVGNTMSFRVQPGAQWQNTNISQMYIDARDWIYAAEE